MFYFILAIHVLLCFILIGLVLLQQGKGADLGAALGGGSNTLFGAGGATAFVVKATTVSAVLFMVTSILLIKYYGASVQPSAVGTAEERLEGSLMKEAVERAQQVPTPGETTDPAGAVSQSATSETAPAVPPSDNVASTAPISAPSPEVPSK